MTIAIPTNEGRLHEHFGGSIEFALVQADPVQRKILGIRTVAAPPEGCEHHEHHDHDHGHHHA